MNLTDGDIQAITHKIKPMLGLPAWDVSLGIGSFLTLEFGEPRILDGGFIGGEWRLWVYCCSWRLETDDEVLVACEDDRADIARIIPVLEDQKLTAVQITRPALETTFTFGNNHFLRIFPIYSMDDHEHWMLFMPGGNILVIGPGTTWSWERSDEPRR